MTKTAREIELEEEVAAGVRRELIHLNRAFRAEKQLEIAIEALKCYAFEEFEEEEIECDELSPNYGVPVIKSFPYAINPELAQQALKEMSL